MSNVLLKASDVSVVFRKGARPALSEANLEIAEGASIGIVGESGSGKTTLGRVLVGALAPTTGEVLVEGRPWSSIKRTDPLRRRVQMIFQDPYGSLTPWLTARQAVSEVLRVWEPMDKRSASERAAELLHEVGLGRQAIDRRPGELSGGQCQRIGIARALACEPRVLIADEPTSALDVSVQAQILNLLEDLRDRHGLALVLVSHDLGVVRHVTDEALVMYAGEVVERGATEELFTAPQHPYTQVLLGSAADAVLAG